MDGQITLEEWRHSRPKHTHGGCTGCACINCLYWWSSRCPHGTCWDDYRAVGDPYDKGHIEKSRRTNWSDWDKPGEQAHWCRGGENYPISYSTDFVKYKGQQVKTCLKANVSVFQDGYIYCCLVKSIGCEICYKEFEKKIDLEG